jgi:hypothetical protein
MNAKRTNRSISLLLAAPLALLGACSQESPTVAEEPAVESPAAETSVASAIVLSDVGSDVAREYGIVYRIPDAVAAGYVAGGRNDLTRYNDDDSLAFQQMLTISTDA